MRPQVTACRASLCAPQAVISATRHPLFGGISSAPGHLPVTSGAAGDSAEAQTLQGRDLPLNARWHGPGVVLHPPAAFWGPNPSVCSQHGHPTAPGLHPTSRAAVRQVVGLGPCWRYLGRRLKEPGWDRAVSTGFCRAVRFRVFVVNPHSAPFFC